MITKTIKHIDGVTKIKAKGIIKDGYFTGEYKFEGMTYGFNIPCNDNN